MLNMNLNVNIEDLGCTTCMQRAKSFRKCIVCGLISLLLSIYNTGVCIVLGIEHWFSKCGPRASGGPQ